MKTSFLFRTGLIAALGFASVCAHAGTLGTESPDYNNTMGDPTLSVVSAGAHTITGTIGPSPTDIQDQFAVQIPANLQVTSISYSGKTNDDNGNPMPLSATGCGFSSINQTLGSPASSCTINFNVAGNFLVASYGWTVTVNTQVPPNNAPTAASFSPASGPFEGLSHIFATSNFGYSDSDSDPLAHVRIVTVPAAGTLYVDANSNDSLDGGEALANGAIVSKANLDAGNLQYFQSGSTNTSFTFDVNDGTDYSSGSYTATLNVAARPTVTLAVSPSSRTESVTTANTVTATLSNMYGAPVTVNLAFSGTATLTSDYTRSGTSIVIGAGSTIGTVTISNVGDTVFEGDETVIVDIDSVTNGSESGTQQVTYTITEDDAAPTATLELTASDLGPFNGVTAADITDESGGQLFVVAKLSASSIVSTTIPLSFSGTASGGGTDYSLTGSTIVIPAGQTTGSVRITSQFDGIEEGNETVVVDMGTPTNATESGTQQVTATIIDEDAVAPTVTSVTVPVNGNYSSGGNLNFTVNTSEAVTVNTSGGTPQIALTIGATTRQASYVTGSGTSTLVFRYTVASGDEDNDGIAIASAINLNGGTLRDAAGLDLNTTLNSVGSLAGVLVDAVPPTVVSVAGPANGSYRVGDNLDIVVTMSENTSVATFFGSLRVQLTIGATVREANYLNGSGTSTLRFRYTVQAGETDADGITISGTELTGGALVNDTAGNFAVRTLNNIADTSAVLVDNTPPTIGSVVVPANGTYVAGQDLFFVINATENITVNTTSGTPQLGLTIGTTARQAVYDSGSGSSSLLFRYTVQSGDLDSNGIAIGSLAANGGTLRDPAGNALVMTLNGVGSTAAVLVDAVVPTISSVSVPAANTYIIGENLDFIVNTSEAVTVNTAGGTPSLPLTIGSTVRQAAYLSGSGSSALLFRYTVQSGDLDTDGVSLAALSANGGTLRDAAGNNLTATLNSVGSTAAVLVDGVVPSVSSIALSGTPASNAGSISYLVTFSESVNNLSADDFTLTTVSGNASGRVASVSAASGSSVTVTVDTLYGVGSLRLDLNGGTDIADVAGNSGVATFTTGAVHSVSRLPSITSATYDAATATLVVTGQHFSALAGAANDIDVSLLSFVGEAGSSMSVASYNYVSPYTLSATADVEIISDTQFSVQLGAADRAPVSGLMTANGAAANDGTVYSLVAADNWLAAAPAALDIADAGNTLIVSNAFTLATSSADTSSFNGTDGSATATPSGGAGGYVVLWSNGATTATANNLSAGNYSVGVTDADGTVRGAMVEVLDPVNTLGQVSITGAAVIGQVLTANPTDADGISGAITYQWLSGATSVGTDSANYTVQASDLGNSISVSVSYVDDIGYTENNTSAATAGVITVEQNALNIISGTANNSGSSAPGVGEYEDAGVTGVTAQILALINRAVARQGSVTDVDEQSEIQALVEAILEGQDGDGDGLPNIFEGNGGQDSDGDGIADRDDTDADNDGIADALELSAITGDTDNDGILDVFDADVGNDDLDGTDEGKTDNNFDGVNDDVDTLGEVISLFTNNADGDEYPDVVDADADGDGFTDLGVTDADMDGVIDGQEALADVLATLMLIDADRDTAFNHLDLDSDNDSVPDMTEAGLSDLNENALNDEAEAVITDALLLPDTDVNNVPNFLQVDSDGISFDILTGIHSGDVATLDANNDGRIDDDTDSDVDGIADGVDSLVGWGLDNDVDDDGIRDVEDPRVGTTPDVKDGSNVLGSFGFGLVAMLLLAGRRRRLAIGALALLLSAVNATADEADAGLELSASIGMVWLDPDVASPLQVTNDSDALYQVALGTADINGWQFQIRYTDFGDADISGNAELEYTAMTAAVRYSHSLSETFSISALAGPTWLRTDSATLSIDDSSSNEVFVGASANMHLQDNWVARLEIGQYGDELTALALGLAKSFR